MTATGHRLRVLADGVPFETARQRGIHRYCHEVFARNAAACDTTVLLARPAAMPVPPGCRVGAAVGTDPVGRLDVAARVARKRRHRAQARAAAAADLYHATYFAPPPDGLPSVVTVYDMIVETRPELFPEAEGFVEAKRAAMAAAARIVTISVAAADEVAACYPAFGDKLVPVPLGADHAGSPAATASDGGPGDRVVFVGDRPLYKNFRGLVEAVATAGWPAGVRVAVVGRPFETTERMLLRRYRVEDRVEHLGRPSDAELAAVYASAVALVFPSLAEGFGLPVVEAQRCGCPVACSDLPVFHEVGGPAAEFFDPRDPAAIAAAVGRCRDPDVRRRLRADGRANAARFTWDACAAATLAVYRTVVGGVP